jgi:protein phosphatase
MGTTLTVMWRKGTRVLVGHVGDSRLYGLGSNGLAQMTDDHEEPITGYLTSAIGVAEEIYEVDLFECQIQIGEYYLLATDGLFSDRRRRRVDDEEIEEIIIRHDADLAGACTEMVQTACDRIGDDNVTVVLLYIADKAQESDAEE